MVKKRAATPSVVTDLKKQLKARFRDLGKAQRAAARDLKKLGVRVSAKRMGMGGRSVAKFGPVKLKGGAKVTL